MNIFVLDSDPEIAASYMCDKHVIKMLLESYQLLSTCCRFFGDTNTELYRSTHINHPSSKWIRESKDNYLWLKTHAEALQREYYNRYTKYHASHLRCSKAVKTPPEGIPDIGLTKFALAMPDKYKSDDPIHSYRLYYIREKARFARWTTPSKVPDWFIAYHEKYIVVNKDKIVNM